MEQIVYAVYFWYKRLVDFEYTGTNGIPYPITDDCDLIRTFSTHDKAVAYCESVGTLKSEDLYKAVIIPDEYIEEDEEDAWFITKNSEYAIKELIVE